VRFVSAGLVAAVTAACAGGSPGVATPHPVLRSEVVPAGYVSLGRVTADCHRTQLWERFRGVPATSLFCDRALLDRALEEQAWRRGGTVLAGVSCHERPSGGRSCAATLARPAHGAEVRAPKATPALPTDSDALSPDVARRIAIDLTPAVEAYARSPRSGAEVQEFASLPIGQVELGLLRARCAPERCDAEQARAGLRAAAGGLGVPSLIAVRCAALDAELSCIATLAATERDPETDPRAH